MLARLFVLVLLIGTATGRAEPEAPLASSDTNTSSAYALLETITV
jgi:hypothetical protein